MKTGLPETTVSSPALTYYSPPRVLDVEPESEDEDAIIERRRQLRQAIVQKYLPVPEVSSMATTPARSESSEDSDTVGKEATKDLEETLHWAELKMKELKEERGGSVGPEKQGKEEKQEQKRSNIQAMKAAVRNGDMFSEIEGDMFGEKYLVSSHTSQCHTSQYHTSQYHTAIPHAHATHPNTTPPMPHSLGVTIVFVYSKAFYT